MSPGLWAASASAGVCTAVIGVSPRAVMMSPGHKDASSAGPPSATVTRAAPAGEESVLRTVRTVTRAASPLLVTLPSSMSWSAMLVMVELGAAKPMPRPVAGLQRRGC